eukprot:RCo054694
MATSSADIESELKRFGLPQYRLGEFLGSGSYGRVWAAENTSTNPVTKVAVKKIVFGLLSEDPTLRAFNARRVLREVTFLGYFRNHPHIVTLLDIAMSPERNCILAVMEAADTDFGKAHGQRHLGFDEPGEVHDVPAALRPALHAQVQRGSP